MVKSSLFSSQITKKYHATFAARKPHFGTKSVKYLVLSAFFKSKSNVFSHAVSTRHSFIRAKTVPVKRYNLEKA